MTLKFASCSLRPEVGCTVWCPVHPAPAECTDCGHRHTNNCKEA